MHTEIHKPNVIVVCGPTAIGKTAVAIGLADQFASEIISADSMQVYRYMDIGTAKPTPAEQALIPHHMIDVVAPDEPFDAKQFATMAQKKIANLQRANIIPMVVGGTGFYIKALLNGLFSVGAADLKIRSRLKKEAACRGSTHLYKRLKDCDPVSAAKIHPNDAYRIIRALEIYELTGVAVSALHRAHKFNDEPFRVLKIGLYMDRKRLYERIEQRVDDMMKAGFVDEVEMLLDRGYTSDLKSMQAIGYRHLVDVIEGRTSLKAALNTLKRDTKRYAKRQITWFKADSEIVWSTTDQTADIRQTIRTFLQIK